MQASSADPQLLLQLECSSIGNVSESYQRYLLSAHEPSSLPPPPVLHPESQSSSSSSQSTKKRQRRNRRRWIMSAHPTLPGASIVTVLERTRVAIYNAPSTACTGADISTNNASTLHTAFTLQEPVPVPSSASRTENGAFDLCWTVFQEFAPHPVLCVVIDSLLYIWDVYPPLKSHHHHHHHHHHARNNHNKNHNSNSSEISWTITLPFRCSSLHSTPCGLLLCRQFDEEDLAVLRFQQQQEQQQQPQPQHLYSELPSRGEMGPRNDPPPRRPVVSFSSPPPLSLSLIPSLFTLSHPLADVVPVVKVEMKEETLNLAVHHRGNHYPHSPHSFVRPWVDAGEEVIWVHSIPMTNSDTSVSPTTTTSIATLCVTYHHFYGRHAMYALHAAPSISPPIPLHQQLKARLNDATGYGTETGSFLAVDMTGTASSSDTAGESPSLLGTMRNGPYYSSATRDAALADALGVSRRRASLGSNASMTGGPLPRHGEYHDQYPSIMLSPRNHSLLHGISMETETHESTFFSPGPYGTATPVTTEAATIPLFSPGRMDWTPPFARQTNMAVTCLYEDIPSTEMLDQLACAASKTAKATSWHPPPPPETQIFMVPDHTTTSSTQTRKSDTHGIDTDGKNGVLLSNWLLCLFQEEKLRFFRVHIASTHSPQMSFLGSDPCHTLTLPKITITPWTEATLHCLAAQAVQGLILVAQRGLPENELKLHLHQGPDHVVQCRLPEEIRCLILPNCNDETLLFDSVHDRVTLRCAFTQHPSTDNSNNNKQRYNYLRICVSLRLMSPLADQVLRVLEAAATMTPSELHMTEWVTKIRADVCIVEQALSQRNAEDTATHLHADLIEDVGFVAVEVVLLALSEYLLLGYVKDERDRDLRGEKKVVSAFEALVSSEFHLSYSHANTHLFLGNKRRDENSSYDEVRKTGLGVINSIGSLALTHLKKKYCGPELVPILFRALHLFYEDCKLRPNSTRSDLPKLARLLHRIVLFASPKSDTMRRFQEYYLSESISATSASGFPSPSVVAMDQITAFKEVPNVLLWIERRMYRDTSQYSIFDEDRLNPACYALCSVTRIIKQLFNSDSEISNDRDLNVVRVLLEEGYTEPRRILDFPPGVAVPLLELFYRCRNDPSLTCLSGWSSGAWHLIGREDLSKNLSLVDSRLSNSARVYSGDNLDLLDPDSDGLVSMETNAAAFYPHDNRIHEVAKLLRSSRPLTLRVLRPVEATDHDFEFIKQTRLSILSMRTLSLSIGRGMFTIGSLSPVAAERLQIPDLCLKGKTPSTNATVILDESECPADLRVWPEFHNGVAAGLRLPASNESSVKITRTWILYNRSAPNSQSPTSIDETNALHQRMGHTHAGLLLALGLRGHLTALEMSDIHEYLTQGSVTTTVGVMLGMAANKRGSCDISVSKMLCLHIPSLIPQHFSAIDVASAVQASALIGCGLLYQRSSHRMMTEFLLNEIGKRPDTDANVFDRDSYTLSCGLALGMVNLAVGTRSGKGDQGAGIADLRVEDRLNRYIVGGVDFEEFKRRSEANDRFSVPSASSNCENDKCCTIYERENINTSVTSPAATLALGLMYMKSNNRTIASTLSIPDTHFMLEFVRPDFLALRVISRALIMWDEVNPLDDWINEQIPCVVKTAYEEMRLIAKQAMEGTIAEKTRLPQYDRRATRQIYNHLIAGACFAIGLRFAGTCDYRAKDVLLRRVMELQGYREGNDPISIALRPDQPILESCLSTAAIALALVMAGSGDLTTLRLFKILRWKCDETSRYGHHMSYGIAIGLLFLGGGSCTVGREPEDLAMLIAAFYHRYPIVTSDNKSHLQAVRHLYALAVKRQDIAAVDVDTGDTVYVPVEINGSRSSSQRFLLPCLLPNSDDTLDELRVLTPQYYPVTISMRNRLGGFFFFVKKRHSLMKNETSLSTVSWEKSSNLLMTSDPSMQVFYKYLVRLSDSSFFLRYLQDCTELDTPEALPLYLALLDRASRSRYWDIRLIRAYYESPYIKEMSFIFKNSTSSTDSGSSAKLAKRFLDVEIILPALYELTERQLPSLNRIDAIDCATSLYERTILRMRTMRIDNV